MSLSLHLNVCIITQQIGQVYSGPGVHATNLAESLAADGHRVWVIAPQSQQPRDSKAYQFIPVPNPLFAGNQARWISLSVSFAKAIDQLSRQESLSLLHFTDAREVLFCRSKLPCIGNINDTYSAELKPLTYYKAHYRDWLVRWLYYQVNHRLEARALVRHKIILANSQYTARVIMRQYPASAHRTQVCYKSIRSERYSHALDLRRSLGSHPPRVLFVGGNMQRKGILNLLHAVPLVVDQIPKVEFWIVGQDPSIPYLIEQTRQMGVEGRVRFLGWKSQEELVEIYSQVNVFAMPSLTEAFGLVFLEAMAAGVPVIGTTVGGNTGDYSGPRKWSSGLRWTARCISGGDRANYPG